MLNRMKQIFFAAVLTLQLIPAFSVVIAQAKVSDPKATVRQFFDLLRNGKYAELYEHLPSEMQQRISREQLKQGLSRLDDFIAIEKMEIGRVQQRDAFAVIETTLYGTLKRPAGNASQKVAGRVVVQQYLFREGAQWKVATADSRTQAQFLKTHPDFSKGFQLTPPKFFIRQSGQWKAMR